MDKSQPWSIKLFGQVSAERKGSVVDRFRTQKTKLLFAYLLLHSKSPIPREYLTDLFWPDDEASKGRLSLRVALSHLREHLVGPDVILADKSTVALDRSTFQLDVEVFRRLIAKARKAEELDERRVLLKHAVSLCEGEICPGAYEEWILQERTQANDELSWALQELVGLTQESNDEAAALRYARQLVSLNPLLEVGRLAVIKSLLKQGRADAARNEYLDFAAMLAEQLNLEPGEALKEIFPTVSRKPSQMRNGFTDSGPCFGRRHDEDQICELLQSQRLVTIHGLGGIGKTKLAHALRDRWSQLGSGEAHFLSFVTCRDSAEVGSATVEQLLPRGARAVQPAEAIANYLAQSPVPTLLILDNVEDVTAGVVDLCSALLASVAQLRILTTSRVPTGASEECVYSLGPIEVPGNELNIENPSLQLFAYRATRADPSFRLTEENASQIASICTAVGGIPLAIEVASAWCSVMTLEQIAQQISESSSFLALETPGHQHRRKSLPDVLSSSMDLLSPETALAFLQLSIFVGGFSLQLVREVVEVQSHAQALWELQRYALIVAERADYGSEKALFDPRTRETIRQREAFGGGLYNRHAKRNSLLPTPLREQRIPSRRD